MKKILIVLLLCLMTCSLVYAEDSDTFDYQETNMKNFWQKNGKQEQKVLDVGAKIINANKLDKHISINTNRNLNVINAVTYKSTKNVVVYYGILPYFDNDDELAFVLGHEMTHAIDSYGGFFKWINMSLNSKEYEYKADLGGIDLMVKAGYNPVAAICTTKKWMPEDYLAFWIFATHPKTSKRLMAMYKYIYIKYPWALKTDMVHNINFENFTYSSQKEINEFLQHEKERADKRNIEDI